MLQIVLCALFGVSALLFAYFSFYYFDHKDPRWKPMAGMMALMLACIALEALTG